ncbi:uncharacterized protein [Macrobrachium rosenbergii]|uniref:uncharacterized protein n=1 Tax=Macrobrachium rosenbergii TaxID=79674 RepID=UPI0034D3F107
MKVLICVLALAAAAAAQTAYFFSDGYLDVLGREPSQTFACAGRPYGYYADVANDCRVFHVCLPVSDDAGDVVDMAQFSFFCGNQTVFSQETLTCSFREDAIPCEESETLYEISNADFGRIVEYDGPVTTDVRVAPRPAPAPAAAPATPSAPEPRVIPAPAPVVEDVADAAEEVAEEVAETLSDDIVEVEAPEE